VYCVFGPCPVGGGGWYGWFSLTWVAVTVSDHTLPAIANVRGSLWSGLWLNGTRRVSFDAGDNTGIKDVRVLVDGREMARAGRGCNPTLKTCPNWPGVALDVATTNGIADGKHRLVIEAVDRGNNRRALARDLYVDNTAPAAPRELAVVGGEGWKPVNRFAVAWKNPTQTASPIVGADYRLCPTVSAAKSCVSGKRDGRDLALIKDLSVPSPGDWTLTLRLRDAAGNSRPETAAAPVHLRFDPDAPVLALEPQDPEDPARIRVAANDPTSAVVRGEVALRRQGDGIWHTTPALMEQSGFTALIDDERLRDGVYELRAHAWDAAGNERSTDRRTSGEPARVVLPVRVKTQLQVGRRAARRVRAAGHKRRTKIIYIRRPLVGHGRKVRLKGRLLAPGRNPLADVPVDVSARMAVTGAAFQPAATLKTSRRGRSATWCRQARAASCGSGTQAPPRSGPTRARLTSGSGQRVRCARIGAVS
jgi:hypothetical protein